MDELGQFLLGIISQGGTLGALTWAITAWIIKQFDVDPSNDKKRWIAIGVPVVLVFGAYFGGALLGYWVVTANSFFLALRPLAAELAGSSVIFATTKAIENKAKQA